MMTELRVSLTNEDTDCVFSEWDEELPEWLANEDGTPNMGAVFRDARSEYGRCISSVYVDTANGPKKVGWYFLSRQEYADYHSTDTYIRGAWVTVR